MEVAELKRVRDLMKPLLDIGIAVRHRFLANFHQNIILKPGCPLNTIDFPAISNGNAAAHCGNALADAALILFDNVGCIDSNAKTFLTPLIRDLYRFPVEELHALHGTKRRVLDCIATIFSLAPDFKKVLNSNIVYKETRDQWMNLDEVLWRMASRASEKVWDKPHTEGMVVDFERLTKDIVAIHKPQEIPLSDNIWCNTRDEKMKTAIDAIKNDRDWVYQGFKTISQLEEC